MSLLEGIKSPQDLKKVPLRDLPKLAQEIRELIVSTVNRNGGHMASNLGVVELTIALHRIFDSPKDHIIFDVSHQSYAHKILTGRAQDFANIRTSGGYSGYFEPSESEHDILALGHAGCGPSLALGIALGEIMRGGEGYIACIIGDGSLTTGLAYEGLSNIIQENPSNLMVILNDNGMAISKTVGWLARWRGKWLPTLRDELELDRDFQQFEQVAATLAPKVPLGDVVLGLGKGLKSAIQKSLIPEMGHVWDEMGFSYLGPVDGHNIAELIEVIDKAQQYSDKVPFIHVLTNKGRGWGPATQDPTLYHQPGPPKVGPTKPTYSRVFADTVAEIMAADEKVVAISAAMLEGTGLARVKERFPDRVFDVGICEQHAVSVAAGMAREGLKPIVAIYSTFLQRAFDQIVHDVCMNDLHVVFALDRAGLVGQDGKTHHGLYDLAYMRIPPNMIVAVPRDEAQMRNLLFTGIQQSHPFCLRYPRGEVYGVAMPNEPEISPVGTAEVIREGTSVCLAGVGELVYTALDAAVELSKEDINVEVVNVRYIKPLDPVLVGHLCDHINDLIVLEEGTSVGGVTASLLEAISQREGRSPKVHQMAVGDIFASQGEIPELRSRYGLDVDSVVAKVRVIIEGGD